MAHIKKENRAKARCDYIIYAIISPIDKKKIYISRTGQHRLRKHYTEHVNLRVAKTEKMFSSAIEAGMLPPIYVLETGHFSKDEAFCRCIAWLKFFLDYGYSQYTKDILTDYAKDLSEETKQIYDCIKKGSLEEVLKPDGGEYKDYKLRTESSKNGILLRLEMDEYEAIRKTAEDEGLSINAYCKKMALNKKIMKVDLTYIHEYLAEFSEIKNLMKNILYAIYKTEKYLPADLQNIQSSVDRMTELQEKANTQITNTIHTYREEA